MMKIYQIYCMHLKQSFDRLNKCVCCLLLHTAYPRLCCAGVQDTHPHSFSSLSQDYTATIYLRQRWTDPRLVFHGNKSFTLDARLVELLWVPDTYIVESKRSFLHDVTVGNRLIRLFSNGTILYALR